MEKWDAIVAIIALFIGSLPAFLIASALGLIAFGSLLAVILPFVPLIICVALGVWISDTLEDSEWAAPILVLFIIIGVVLMLLAGFGGLGGGHTTW